MSVPVFGSLFSGIGGFDLGLEAAGWECAFQVEIDPFCTKVLERHWPHVRRDRDIRDVTFAPPAGEQLPVGAGSPDRGPRIDLLCGGFPCQDLSVAGRRAGIAGARSGLFFEFVRLATELRPRWLLLENVPGLLSSNGGRDFAVVLAALGDAGYGVGWRVLDSRWFGVPQRRRRVFLVGRLGAPCPYAVLFESPGLPGHPAAGDGAGEDAPAGIAGELGDDGGGVTFTPWDTQSRREHAATGPVPTLQKRGHRGHESLRVLAFTQNQRDEVRDLNDLAGALASQEGMKQRTYLAQPAALYYSHDYNQDRVYDPQGIAPAVCAQDSSGARQFLTGAAVRRLTPTECERLMGLPDGHTCLCGVEPYSTWDCRCPDGPRYAACGNAVVTNVVEWLGRRLLAAQTEESA